MRLAQSVPTTLFFIHLEVIMQFPRSEAEIAKLTVAVAQGLEDAAGRRVGGGREFAIRRAMAWSGRCVYL